VEVVVPAQARSSAGVELGVHGRCSESGGREEGEDSGNAELHGGEV
jgi:hypothetical protein